MAPAAAKIQKAKISDFFSKAQAKKGTPQSSPDVAVQSPARRKRPALNDTERPTKKSNSHTPSRPTNTFPVSSDSEYEPTGSHSTRPTTPSKETPGLSSASKSPPTTSTASARGGSEEQIPSSDLDEVDISVTKISADLPFPAPARVPPPADTQISGATTSMTDGSLKPSEAPSASISAASEARTRAIIENIKARALHSSKAETPVIPAQPDDDDESSDDDINVFSKIATKRLPPSEPVNARKARLRAYTAPTAGPSSSRSTPVPAPAPRASTFLDGLLREQKKKTKAGGPTNEGDRLARIEATLAMLNRANMNGTGVFDDEEEVEDEQDQSAYVAVLGSKEAKRVGKLLESDKIGRQMERDNKLAPAWTFWIQASDDVDDVMDANEALPPLDIPSSCGAILHAVAAAARENDASTLRTWMTSGLLNLEQDDAQRHMSRWLFLLAAGLHGLEWSDLAVGCFRALQSNPMKQPCDIPWAELPRILSSLGASAQALGLLEGVDVASLPPRAIPLTARTAALLNVTDFVDTAVRSRSFPLQPIPHVYVIFLLLGIDPSTSASSRIRISSILENLVASLPDSDEGNTIEFRICQTILSSTKNLPIGPRRQLLVLIPGGHPRVRRVMRAVANAWLVPGMKNVNTETYLKAHSIDCIIGLLSDSPFAITEETDYVALLHSTEILNVALTDLNGYFPNGTSVFRKRAPLEQLVAQLETLENRIVDTRASHLDRTWVKDALLRLRMRIHYQTMLLVKDGSKITNWTKGAMTS